MSEILNVLRGVWNVFLVVLVIEFSCISIVILLAAIRQLLTYLYKNKFDFIANQLFEAAKFRSFFKDPKFEYISDTYCLETCENYGKCSFGGAIGAHRKILSFPSLDEYLISCKPFKFRFLNEEIRYRARKLILKNLGIRESFCDSPISNRA